MFYGHRDRRNVSLPENNSRKSRRSHHLVEGSVYQEQPPLTVFASLQSTIDRQLVTWYMTAMSLAMFTSVEVTMGGRHSSFFRTLFKCSLFSYTTS